MTEGVQITEDALYIVLLNVRLDATFIMLCCRDCKFISLAILSTSTEAVSRAKTVVVSDTPMMNHSYSGGN